MGKTYLLLRLLSALFQNVESVGVLLDVKLVQGVVRQGLSLHTRFVSNFTPAVPLLE